METVVTLLKEQWTQLKNGNPKLRIRDAAKQLGVSEAELVNLGVGEHHTLLNNDFRNLLQEIPSLGYVMALTRNDICVNERKGIYTKVSFTGDIGLVHNDDIDLRLFMKNWRFGFAVNENDRRSLQFFDEHGDAVHKIYLTDRSNTEAYQQLVKKYQADNQAENLIIKREKTPSAEKPDNEINITALQKDWLSLSDTHDFHHMLQRHGVTRTQALRLAPEDHAKRISLKDLKETLTFISEKAYPIMVFTGNSGCIQIHVGKIQKLVQMDNWFNVLDPEFNMHLKEDGIASMWLVKKPTNLGAIHSIEAYDSQGDTIVQFFGARDIKEPENQEWRKALAATLSITF